MANLATITTTSSAVVPAISITNADGVQTTIVGSFSAELQGKIFSISGGGKKLSYDLTIDTIRIDSTDCTSSTVMSVFSNEFVK